MKVSRPLRLLPQCLGWPVAGSLRVAVGPCIQPPPGPRPGGGRWAAPFEAPPPAGGRLSGGRLIHELAPGGGPPPTGGAALVNRKRRAPPPWPVCDWHGARPGDDPRWQWPAAGRRLARLAPVDAKAGSAPGPEADPALGGAASCESRAQMMAVSACRFQWHLRVRRDRDSACQWHKIATAVAGDGRPAEWPRGLPVRAAARAFTGRLGSAHWQLEAAASFWHATAATGSGSPGARDFGREASPLVYAAPNLTLIA